MVPHSPWFPSPPPAEARASVLICRYGVLLPSTDNPLFKYSRDWREYGGNSVTLNDGLLLPNCREADMLLPQPPLKLALDQDHLAALLRAERQGTLAATIVGPPQEKKHNEDFAIAAGIVDDYGRDHAFIAVADGVTTKTFWAERASRIACFVALKWAMDYVYSYPNYSVQDIERFRSGLSSKLREALELDRSWLIEQAAVPQDWDVGSFRKFSGTISLWYNTTLLLSLVGPEAAMILWSGDGAICLSKRFKDGRIENSSPLRSTDDFSVNNVVSLSGPISFSGGRIDITEDLKGLTVIICSDGPDRTLQRNGDPIEILDVSSSMSVARTLDTLAQYENREVDNYSAAVAHWPVVRSRHITRTLLDRLLWPLAAVLPRSDTPARYLSRHPSNMLAGSPFGNGQQVDNPIDPITPSNNDANNPGILPQSRASIRQTERGDSTVAKIRELFRRGKTD